MKWLSWEHITLDKATIVVPKRNETKRNETKRNETKRKRFFEVETVSLRSLLFEKFAFSSNNSSNSTSNTGTAIQLYVEHQGKREEERGRERKRERISCSTEF